MIVFTDMQAVLPVVAPWQIVAWVLLACWALVLVLGFVFGRVGENESNRIPRPLRMLSSAILVTCALIWWLAPVDSHLQTPQFYLFLGMLLSFAGDVALSGIIGGKRRLWLGMGAFGMAHVLYIVAILRLNELVGWPGALPSALAIATIFLVGLLGWRFVVRSPDQSLRLNVASLLYCSLLISMSGLALVGGLSDTRMVGMAIGSLLFVFSDSLVGYRSVRGGHFRLIGDLTWMTYIVGQLLIVLSPAVAFGLV